MFWKDGLFKKSHWNMIFLVVLSGKMIFLFPENMILFFRRKMKDDLSQKSTWKYDIFIKCPEKMTFPKKTKKKSRRDMIFLVLSGKMIIFFRKIWSFYFRRKMKDEFSQGINGSMIFSVYMYECYKYDITFLQKEKLKMMFTRKNSLKGYWHSRSHSRKSSKNSLCFYRNLYKRFNILLSSEKKQET